MDGYDIIKKGTPENFKWRIMSYEDYERSESGDFIFKIYFFYIFYIIFFLTLNIQSLFSSTDLPFYFPFHEYRNAALELHRLTRSNGLTASSATNTEKNQRAITPLKLIFSIFFNTFVDVN